MNEQEIRRLVKIVEEADIASLEIKRWGRSIRIVKRGVGAENGHGAQQVENLAAYHPPPMPTAPSSAPPGPASTPGSPDSAQSAAPQPTDQPAASTAGLIEIKSPMVGTFYRAPAPDAAPYVEVGQRIEVGKVLCIIEAMKLMNEFEAETAGEVVKINIENGEPVEYGQVLMLIKP